LPDGPTVDLHVHSSASDGGLAPEAVVERARAAGLAAVALTDHDTVAGLPAALAAGARLGVRVVTGCEFSVAVSWGEMHLLGYFLPAESDELEAFLVRCRADRERRGRAMVDRVRAVGVSLDFDQVLAAAGGGAIGRPHVARALVEGGHAGDLKEAFERFLGNGKPAFVAKDKLSLEEAIALIHRAGGIAVLAHPGQSGTRDRITTLARIGLDGVEVLHPSHSWDDARKLDALAGELGLVRSGGSDWHGGTDGARTLGMMRVPSQWLHDQDARVATSRARRVA